MRVLRILLLVLAAEVLAVQEPGPVTIEGVSVIAGSSDPVSGVVMELRRNGAGSPDPAFAVTQSNGSFLFRNVPPGRYLLSATRNGYLPAEWGQKDPNGRGLPLVVTAGQPMTELRLAMTPTATLSGRIVDRAGQAMPGLPVQLMKAVFQDGRRTMSVVKSMLTNDLGEYRIFWVPPGSYYVNVLPFPDTPFGNGIPLVMSPAGPPANRTLWSGQSNAALRPVGSGLPESEAYLPIYFPGTADEDAATPIDLSPGAEVRSIDIRVTPARAWRVRGLVLNGTTRQPVPNASLLLLSAAAGSTRVLQATSDAMGMYAIPRVPTGPYVLLANSNAGSRLVNIEVRESDIDATVELQPPYSISGRVNAPNPAALTVRLRLDFPIPNPPQLSATPAPDGSFTFRSVSPGDYRVFVAPLLVPAVPPPPSAPSALQNSYVKSMRVGDVDLLNGRLRVDRPLEAQIDIQVATDSGGLSGRVLGSRQEAMSAATVVLMPDADRRVLRPDLYKVTTTDESGQFLMEAVPPGDYRVFAWDNVADRAWQDPAFMRTVEERGRAVHISENARQTVEISAIP